jgi:competence protein ComEC
MGIITVLSTGAEFSAGTSFLITFLCFVCLIIAFNFFRSDYKLRWISGVFSTAGLFFAGMYIASIAGDKFGNTSFIPANEGIPRSTYLCRIEEKPIDRGNSIITTVTTLAVMDSLRQWHHIESGILVYFKDDSLLTPLSYGDLIVVSTVLQTVPNPANPDMFNYRKYLFNRHIYYQGFLESGHWQRIGVAIHNPVKAWAEACRGKFLDVFRKYKVGGQDFALVAALVLGSRDFLDRDIQREFSHAGAIHVLSVSGLHVGIMYLVAQKILFFLNGGRRSRKVQQVMIIGFIWAYAFITGLPSSVIRAALMFSLIAAAKMLKRSSDNYNILAVAAFVQLWIDPYEITQIGFQLSYLAVLGIFAFYSPLNELIKPINRVIAWTWSLLAVSLAAQLTTFPLSSLYFNMFPVYFLLTNLIVVPLAAVITYFAVFLLTSGAVGIFFEWMAYPLIWNLHLLSGSVKIIQSWPGAVIESVVFTHAQVILIYIAIFAIFAYGVLAYRKWALVLLGSLLLFSLSCSKARYDKLKHKEIILYHIPGHSAIDFINDQHAFFLCDSALANDLKKLEFNIKPHRVNIGIRKVTPINVDSYADLSYPGFYQLYPFIFFEGMRILVIDQQWHDVKPDKCMELDLVIIRGTPRIKPEELTGQFYIRQVVIDSSVPFYIAEKLLLDFKKAFIPCHSVKHDSAFIKWW